MDAVLSHLHSSPGRPPKVEALAQRAGLRLRALERVMRRAGLPPPKRLADWITLLYVEVMRAQGHATSAAARRLGLLDGDLYRLRRRLLPDLSWRGHGSLPAHLDLAFARLTRECGARPRRPAARTGRAEPAA